MIKKFGPGGKIKIYFSVKVTRKYSPAMLYCCNAVEDAVRMIKLFRKARQEVKKLHGSRYLSGRGFARYSLRWLACHNCEVYIVDENDNGKSFKFTAPYLEYIREIDERR